MYSFISDTLSNSGAKQQASCAPVGWTTNPSKAISRPTHSDTTAAKPSANSRSANWPKDSRTTTRSSQSLHNRISLDQHHQVKSWLQPLDWMVFWANPFYLVAFLSSSSATFCQESKLRRSLVMDLHLGLLLLEDRPLNKQNQDAVCEDCCCPCRIKEGTRTR